MKAAHDTNRLKVHTNRLREAWTPGETREPARALMLCYLCLLALATIFRDVSGPGASRVELGTGHSGVRDVEHERRHDQEESDDHDAVGERWSRWRHQYPS
jgi:hypothetical protein